jgi:hypothetical protein
VYFRDVVVGKPLAIPYFSFGTSNPINFLVYRYNSTSFDVLMCSQTGGGDACQIMQTNNFRKNVFSLITIQRAVNISLPDGQCAQSTIIRPSFLIVSCPRFGAQQGQIQIYWRNSSDLSLNLIWQETGNSSTPDYGSIGASFDFMEFDSNQAIMFYTSTLVENGILYTMVNTVEIMKIVDPFAGTTRFVTVTNINKYRDRSNDTISLGNISLSTFNSTLFLTIEKIIPSKVKYMPLCRNSQFFDATSFTCQ